MTFMKGSAAYESGIEPALAPPASKLAYSHSQGRPSTNKDDICDLVKEGINIYEHTQECNTKHYNDARLICIP